MGDVSLEDQGRARWDAYRLAYPTMTYAEVAEAHGWVWDNYPDQSHHSVGRLDAFFDSLAQPGVVIEVGGWRGEAAARQLARHASIVGWTNWEICKPAVLNTVVEDPRYHAWWADRWVWELPAPAADTAVLSHVVEHVSDEQLPKLLDWIDRSGARAVYIEAPLQDAGQGWMGGNTAHLLTIGWDGLAAMLHERGFATTRRQLAKLDHYVMVATR